MKHFKNKLHEFLHKATKEEQNTLAEKCQTSVKYLQQLGNEERFPSADIGGKIELAAKDLTRRSKGRLPLLRRGDIVPACGVCPFFKRCTR